MRDVVFVGIDMILIDILSVIIVLLSSSTSSLSSTSRQVSTQLNSTQLKGKGGGIAVGMLWISIV